MIDHADRIRGVVKGALKQAAMGEPFGYAVEFSFVLQATPNGQPSLQPCWCVLVTIRGGLGEGDIGNALPVPGLLPDNGILEGVALRLLEQCRQERQEKADKAKAALGLNLSAERRSA